MLKSTFEATNIMRLLKAVMGRQKDSLVLLIWAECLAHRKWKFNRSVIQLRFCLFFFFFLLVWQGGAGWGGDMFLLLRVSEVAQSCPTLCDPMDCSLPHGL